MKGLFCISVPLTSNLAFVIIIIIAIIILLLLFLVCIPGLVHYSSRVLQCLFIQTIAVKVFVFARFLKQWEWCEYGEGVLSICFPSYIFVAAAAVIFPNHNSLKLDKVYFADGIALLES